ncbi:subtelomeric sfi-fragment-related protein family member, putative [Theileria annulata]|uniref:Subtelomeric sfi-fragment-related protein family member, putative n=1 Tax=Theileria annulata TaxID=5874 RepID=Q4UD98_THEAN|nr:subtelomeric sfi-fragment-related protein family member, putative [Theileria annulata]CAI74941.1 subtelomeric sfi-fragment-related protein family member, putative [Theileria annulata]
MNFKNGFSGALKSMNEPIFKKIILDINEETPINNYVKCKIKRNSVYFKSRFGTRINKIIDSKHVLNGNPLVVWESDNEDELIKDVSYYINGFGEKYLAMLFENNNYAFLQFSEYYSVVKNNTHERKNLNFYKFYDINDSTYKKLEDVIDLYLIDLKGFKYSVEFHFSKDYKKKFGKNLPIQLNYNIFKDELYIKFIDGRIEFLNVNNKNIKLFDKKEKINSLNKLCQTNEFSINTNITNIHNSTTTIPLNTINKINESDAHTLSRVDSVDNSLNFYNIESFINNKRSFNNSTYFTNNGIKLVVVDIKKEEPTKEYNCINSGKFIEFRCYSGCGITKVLESNGRRVPRLIWSSPEPNCHACRIFLNKDNDNKYLMLLSTTNNYLLYHYSDEYCCWEDITQTRITLRKLKLYKNNGDEIELTNCRVVFENFECKVSISDDCVRAECENSSFSISVKQNENDIIDLILINLLYNTVVVFLKKGKPILLSLL